MYIYIYISCIHEYAHRACTVELDVFRLYTLQICMVNVYTEQNVFRLCITKNTYAELNVFRLCIIVNVYSELDALRLCITVNVYAELKVFRLCINVYAELNVFRLYAVYILLLRYMQRPVLLRILTVFRRRCISTRHPVYVYMYTMIHIHILTSGWGVEWSR